MEETVLYRSPKENTAGLVIMDRRSTPIFVPLREQMTVGREYARATSDIRLQSSIVSRDQGGFLYREKKDTWYYIDHNSTNGTFVNGVHLAPGASGEEQVWSLSDGDLLRIDRDLDGQPHSESVIMLFTRGLPDSTQWQRIQLPPAGRIAIGRDERNTIIIPDMSVSRRHAVIERTEQGWVLKDCDSQNGISVNGTDINVAKLLFNHDVFRIADTVFIYWDGFLYFNLNKRTSAAPSGKKSNCSLNVRIEKKTVNRGKRTLIKDIRFDARGGDFILILGGSGAGKTTLINSILGEGKADGEILLDGKNLYTNFKSMKSQIGLVPQFLNLRTGDGVEQTLLDVADIKFGRGEFTKAEKVKRVREIMEHLGISNLNKHLIGQLSGGQKKKVSVAAQMVGFQKVFICDEPDSGLDAASRMQQMEILSEIADNGKIVMVISHEPDDAWDRENNCSRFTKVLVIAKSSKDNCGHMAFYGSPDEALSYFGVTRLQDIMQEINPVHEGGLGHADRYIEKCEQSLKRRDAELRRSSHGRLRF